MNSNNAIVVKLYGHIVGYLAMHNGKVVFEYEELFKKTGLEISPLKLPTSTTTSSYNNTDDKFFESLPGVLHDSLPDAFGNKIIENYYHRKGIENYDLTVLQRLAYIGQNGMGALEYEPTNVNQEIKEALEVQSLVEDARKIISGEIDDAIPDIMESGGSAGGARAKAVIAWNKQNNKIRSGRAKYIDGYEQYVLKFDGMGEKKEPEDYAKVEFMYMEIARKCGLNVAEVELLSERSYNHLLVKRFDRVQGQKVHLHSLCGMTHMNFNIPRLFSYEDYLRTVRRVTNDFDSILNAFSHMIFNVVSRNQDDHTKNFSFLMDQKGEWVSSPIYDLTYCNGSNHTSKHQMTINGKSDEFTRDDFYKMSKILDIDINIMDEVIDLIQDIFVNEVHKIGKDLEISDKKINRILSTARTTF